MTRVLKPKGILLVSGMNRVMEPRMDEGAEDEKGYFVSGESFGGTMYSYAGDRNVFNCKGEIIPPGKAIEILNVQNPHFPLEYGVAHSGLSGPTLGHVEKGGQVSGQRLSAESNLELSNMFYCFAMGKLGYMLAQTTEKKLRCKSKAMLTFTTD